VTNPDEDFAPPPPRSRFRWVRRFALWALGVFAVIVLVLFVGRWQTSRLGQRQLTVTTNRLDADEPGWRLEAILDERKKAEPPPNENSAPVVLEIAEGIPEEWRKWRDSEQAMALWGRRGDNRLPPQEAIDDARKPAAATLLVRTDAIRLLRDKRRGQFPLTINPDPIATLLPHLDKCRTVVSLLQYDGYLSAIEKNPNRGISAARAALAVARAIGDEPLLISQLVRIACATVAAQTAMQVLAWGEPTEGLAELQAELLAEAEFQHFRTGMQGERGMIDKMFRNLQDGTIPAKHWFVYADIHDPGPEHYAAFRAYRALIPGDHAKALEILTAYHEAAKLPDHEQLAALKAVPIPQGPPNEFRYILTRLLTPAGGKIAEAGLRCRADLRAAATGVACERFRVKHGRWPRELAELVPAFLPAVPLNPFDGKPLGYRVIADRVAVYCFWPDAPMKIDFPEEFRAGTAPGIGIGYRVWNPNRRGLPAEEKKDP
jgi:hypothetical protein